MRRAAAWLALAGALPSLGEPGKSVVHVSTPARIELACERPATAHVLVQVKRGYHVQANPVLDPALIPITLTIESPMALEVGAPRYPAPKRFRLRGTEEDLLVLDGRFAIEFPVRATAAAAGEAKLVGRLRYQACDDDRCLFPRTLPIDIPARIDSSECPAHGHGPTADRPG